MYTPKQKGRKYSDETKKQAIKLYMEGNIGRAVRILGLSKNICLYCIKKYAKKINERVEVIEMDELYPFIERKNRIYVITLVNRDKQQIVDYDIAFDKSRKRIPNLVDSYVRANRCYSNSYPDYSEILYGGLHTSLKNKNQAYNVEGVNSDLRHYVPTFKT